MKIAVKANNFERALEFMWCMHMNHMKHYRFKDSCIMEKDHTIHTYIS